MVDRLEDTERMTARGRELIAETVALTDRLEAQNTEFHGLLLQYKADAPARKERADNERRELATDAAQVAVDSIGEAYQNPHVRQAALYAAELALGLREYPHQNEEGEL
jgi:hypothetical protein